MDKGFFTANRKKLADKLEDGSLVIMIAGKAPIKSADEYYDFTPNRNFYYITGIDVEKAVFLMAKNKGKLEEYLFIEEPDSFKEKWTGKMMDKDCAMEQSGISNIVYLDKFMVSVSGKIYGGCNNLYLDFGMDDSEQPLSNVQSFARDMKERYPYITIKNIHDTICTLRVIKTEEEVKNIRKAIEVTKEGILSMMKNSRPNMMEYELEAYFDFTLKSHGVKTAFNTIAASGVNGAVLHYSKNNSRAGEDDLVLLDLGAEYGYYSSDISRTFPLNGRFTKRQKEVYSIVLEAELKTIEAMKPGVPVRSLNDITKKVLAEGLRKLGLINEDSELSRYYYHGVSHYLGLDTHDVGNYDRELAEGMVLTVEPGLYIGEEGIGVRIEDNVLINNMGCEVLSKDIIKTIDEIEEYMRR